MTVVFLYWRLDSDDFDNIDQSGCHLFGYVGGRWNLDVQHSQIGAYIITRDI